LQASKKKGFLHHRTIAVGYLTPYNPMCYDVCSQKHQKKIFDVQSREQTFHRTTHFLNLSACHQSTVLDFNAKVCFTMQAMGSAGWDDSTIRYVCSIDFPFDMLSIKAQGRAGRCFTTIGNDNTYYCVASLESYLYLLR
jgi:hypothetical protein